MIVVKETLPRPQAMEAFNLRADIAPWQVGLIEHLAWKLSVTPDSIVKAALTLYFSVMQDNIEKSFMDRSLMLDDGNDDLIPILDSKFMKKGEKQMSDELETQPVPVEQVEVPTIGLHMDASPDDVRLIRELGKRWGMLYFKDIVRQAVSDALAHYDCPSPEELDDLRSRLAEYEAEELGEGEEDEETGDEEPEAEPKDKTPAPPEIPSEVVRYIGTALRDGYKSHVRGLLAPDGHRDGRIVSRTVTVGKSGRAGLAATREFLARPGGREALLAFLAEEGHKIEY